MVSCTCDTTLVVLDVTFAIKFPLLQMHTHHSHSGTYIAHAADELDEIVARAHQLGFSTLCLTEHMPRLYHRFLYPEETERSMSISDLQSQFDKYLEHGKRLKKQYAELGLEILLGFEVEGINEAHIQYASKLLPTVDMCVGSVHFVNEIPIDFSPELWLDARNLIAEKTTRALFKAYFELQHQVISAVKPHVIGHIDLIRLFAPAEIDPTTGKQYTEISIEQDWPEVWQQIVDNITLAKSYGALFELNSSAIRKGWSSPYPKKDIAYAIIKYGDARFCLSDDAHSIAQVGLNYHKVLDYIKSLGLKDVYYLTRDGSSTEVRSISTQTLQQSTFWAQFTQ